MTPYSEIFNPFLKKVKDHMYAELPVTISEGELLQLLNEAVADFLFSKIDLLDKDDLNQTFNNSLGLYEIQMLASIMAVFWFERALFDADLLSPPALITKDFNENSGGNHIKAINSSLIALRKDLERRKKLYSRQGKWSQLGGGI